MRLLIVVSLLLVTASSAFAQARPALCLVEIAGTHHLGGDCSFLPTDKSGSFEVTSADGTLVARVVVTKKDEGLLSLKTAQQDKAQELGEVSRANGCWVLFGDVEPGGRLPQSFPVRWGDNPTQSQDREVYPGLHGKVRYEEGLFVGYRHSDKTGIAPLYPFGFGLGYTDFSLGELTLDQSRFEADGEVAATFTVANTGNRRGSTVVQLYVGDDEASAPRPAKELKAFAKVQLAPGESRRVTLTLDARAFAFYRPEAKHWLVEPGRFTLLLGTSSADIAARTSVTRTTTLMLAV